MTTAVRVPRGGTGGFTPSPFALRTVTAASQGGAVVVNQSWGKYDATTGLYLFVYVRGDNGNIEIVTHNYATNTTSSPFVLHAALQVDVHAAPSLEILADGHYVVAYSVHSASPIYIRRSTNAHDITAWATEQTQGHGASTYCNLFELTAEGKLYLFFRWGHDGPTTHTLMYIVSSDGGVTWSADVQVYEVAHVQNYWHVMGNGVDRIDFVATEIVPSASSHSSLYHFYYTGGSYHKTDGTLISAGLPFSNTSATKIIDGPTVGGGCFPFEISPTGPTVAVVVYLTGGTDNAYYDVRWTGSAWQATFIANAGGVFDGQQATGLSVDVDNPSKYVCGLLIGSNWQMVAYTTADGGLTWVQGRQLTATASPIVHAWPQSIPGHGPDLVRAWLEGTYTSDTVWATGIQGVNV